MEARQLQAHLLKARDSVCEVGRFKFTVRRPTEMALARMSNGRGEMEVNLDVIQNSVVAWDGVLESDIEHGGASDPQPFDKFLYMDWIADRRDLWKPIAQHIEKVCAEHDKKIQALTGN